MSLIIPRNYKRAKAQDAAAMDAQFKVGDRVVSIKTGRKGKIVSPGGRYNPMYGHYGRHEMWNVLFDDEKERIPVLMGSEEIRLANSHSTDAGDAAEFHVGQRVRAKAQDAAGEGRDYYVVDEFGNVADGSKTPLPFSRASALFLKLTGSKSGNGKWGIIRKGEPASKARDWYGNIVSWDTADSRAADAGDAAEFHVGQRVRAKDPSYEYSEGKSLGAGMFTVKEVNNNGDVKLDDYGDVWISPSALVEANDACGKGVKE